jgi:hypothetical protein
MGWFKGSNNESSKGSVGTDGRGGFVSVDNDGVAFGNGHVDPVDNLIALAGALADADGDDDD